jgi:arylsulfatase A-like enzyme
MRVKTKKRIRNIVLILIPILGYLLWPLSSPDYDIVFDADKIAYRAQYMATKQPIDSVSPPNIIVILADDLSKMDVSLYGGEHLQTPHMDAIGKNGVTFQEAYITSPICAPSRAGLLTGRYQQRFGFEIQVHERYPKNRLEYFVYDNFIATEDWQVAPLDEYAIPTFEVMQKQGLPPTEFILSEILKTKDYATACIGKWHLGYNPTAIPSNRGFDYQYGFYEAFSLYAPIDKDSIINQKLTDFSDPFIWGKGRTGNCAIRRNGEVIQEDVYLTTKITEETIDFIKKNKDQPFFAYVPYSSPHTPFQITKDYYDQFSHIASPEKRVYYAMIKSLDDAVGEIMQTLKDMNLEENTIVYFLSDNGGAEYTLAADNSPLKGGKMSNFEGGINIPFMMQWKGTIPAGKVYEKPVSALDIFATTTAIASCELPKDRTFDGVNLMPYLLDSSYQEKVPHSALFWRSMTHKAVRKGDWKLLRDDKANKKELYNLVNDKYETTNLVDSLPEVVKQLETDYTDWEKEMINPRWPRVMDRAYEIDGGTYYFPL